ncbi:MAG: hypothetical protein Q7K25_10000 [Actinomycetota bacterium]|nr:hypothetical protein [Actinomycetota bacterium]
MASPDLLGFYITDRNTKGLSGPMQADQSDADDTYDWVDFVLNVGEANTHGHTGGTYGFGKTISYVVSTANAVVIHTHTIYKGRPQARLIACALGQKFTRKGKLFTGRHWWGEDAGGAPLPITGRDADRIAEQIGMPEFHGSETGTNILVVAPDLAERTPEQSMRFIAESVTWNLWPKLMRHGSKQGMDIYVSWNGENVAIPKPEDRPPLHGFAQAFQSILDGGALAPGVPGLRLDTISSRRPNVAIGLLATVPLIHRERAQIDDGSDPENSEAPRSAAAISGASHHVALLRTPELVVDYLEGPPPPEGGTEWAGVFRAEDDQDAFFAAAEPPTHDSWSPELLPKSAGRTIVNVALREIKSALEQRWAPRKLPVHAEIASTALVADELAHLVGPVEGRGKGRIPRETSPPTSGAARPKIEFTQSTPIDLDGDAGTLACVRITPVPKSAGTKLMFSVAAALDGNSADADLDPNLAIVSVRIADERYEVSGRTGTLDIHIREQVELELIARRGPETTVLFDIEAEAIR